VTNIVKIHCSVRIVSKVGVIIGLSNDNTESSFSPMRYYRSLNLIIIWTSINFIRRLSTVQVQRWVYIENSH